MRTTLYIILLFLVISCHNRYKVHHKFDPYYVVKSYNDSSDISKKLVLTRYFDKSNNLLREVYSHGGCTNYIYDKDEKLIETYRARTCGYRGIRKIFIYDSLDNHIGHYWTRDTTVDLDTIKFERTHFYDSVNRLIKEMTDERFDSHGRKIKTWNFYSYNRDLKSSVVIKNNDITQWVGTYKYDSLGRLIELNKALNKNYKIEFFIYNELNQLVEERVKSNDRVIVPQGTFNMPIIKRIYEYDSVGFLFRKTTYRDEKLVGKTYFIKTIIEN